jgi:hypothetical protein
MAKRERSIATKLIDANRWRVHPQEAQQRLQERDQRIAADTRTEVQKYLGDPEPARSALARVTPLGATPTPRGTSWSICGGSDAPLH